MLYGRASESCKWFISRILVVRGQELVLQNAPPHELVSLMFVHTRSFFSANVPDKALSRQNSDSVPSLYAITLHEDATNNQSLSTCPRHL